MSLRVVALGTGVCLNGPEPIENRQPPGFFIEVDGINILFDCSEGIRFRLQQIGIDPGLVTHVAVTHAHPDHAALPQFIQAKFCRHLWGAKDGRETQLHIYMSKMLARDFPQVWNWHQPENDGAYWPEFTPDIVGLKNGERRELGKNIFLIAYHVYHGFGRHPAMGFRLETPYGVIGYTGDSGVCEGVQKIGHNADLLIADCQVRPGQEYTGGYGHMGPKQDGELAKFCNAKELWLTHYIGMDANEVVLAEVRAGGFFGKTSLAQDGQEWRSSK